MVFRGIAFILAFSFGVSVSGFVPSKLKRSSLIRNRASTEQNPKKEKSAKAPDGGSTGHIVAGMKELTPEEQAVQERVATHQQDQEKLGAAEEVRTLVQYNHGFAVISTNSQSLDG